MNKSSFEGKQSPKPLDWDSQHFGIKIGQIADFNSFNHKLFKSFDLLVLHVSSNEAQNLLELQRLGISPLEEKLEFKIQIEQRKKVEGRFKIRKASPSDIPKLKALVGTVSFSTRFTLDGNFDSEKTRALYEIWLEKSVKGEFDSECLTFGSKEIEGFCTLKHNKKEARIGLFGISPQCENQGFAKKFLGAICDRMHGEGIKQLSVVTQAHNQKACHIYSSLGFKIISRSMTFHLWNSARRNPALLHKKSA